MHTTSQQTTSNGYFRLSGHLHGGPGRLGRGGPAAQADPTLTPDTVKARLMLSADKWADPQRQLRPLTYGAGYLNIPAALASTTVAGQPAMSPDLSTDTGGNDVLTRDHAIWGKSSPLGHRPRPTCTRLGQGRLWGIDTL